MKASEKLQALKQKEKEWKEPEYSAEEEVYSYSSDSYYSDDGVYVAQGKGKRGKVYRVPEKSFVTSADTKKKSLALEGTE